MSAIKKSSKQPKLPSYTLAAIVLALAANLSGCSDSGNNSGIPLNSTPPANPSIPSNPSAPTTPINPADITTNTIPASKVEGLILIPSGLVQSSSFASNSEFRASELFRTVLIGWISASYAQDAEDLSKVGAKKIELLKYNPETRKYDNRAGVFGSGRCMGSDSNTDDFSLAITLSNDGSYSIDMQLLADNGVIPNAELASDFIIQVTLEPADSSSPCVALRAPMISEELDISPVTEIIVRRVLSFAPESLANFSIGEMHQLLETAKSTRVANAADQTIEQLVEALTELAGVQIDAQISVYIEPEPDSTHVANMIGHYNLINFGYGLEGASDTSFGSLAIEVYANQNTLELNEQGRGTISSNTSLQSIGADQVHSDLGLDLFYHAKNIETGSDVEISFPARVTGAGSLIVQIPAAEMYDDEISQWHIESATQVILRPLQVNDGVNGFISSNFGVNSTYGDTMEAGASGGSSPDFNKLASRNITAGLTLLLPQAENLQPEDFAENIAQVGLSTTLNKPANIDNPDQARQKVTLFSHYVNRQADGSFNSQGVDFFQLVRQYDHGLNLAHHFFNVPGHSGHQLTTSSNHPGHVFFKLSSGTHSGISAPGGALTVLALQQTSCLNPDDSSTSLYDEMRDCEANGEVTLTHTLGLSFLIPIDTTMSSESLNGNRYRARSYEFNWKQGVTTFRVGSCGFEFVVGSGAIQFEDKVCSYAVRDGENDRVIPHLEVDDGSVGSPVEVPFSLSNGALALDFSALKPDTHSRGYVSADGNLMTFWEGSTGDESGDGRAVIYIAQRVPASP